MKNRLSLCALGTFLLLLAACSDRPTAPEVSSPAPTADTASSTTASPADIWWGNLSALCGKAFAGRLVSIDEADADLRDQPMVMHVRKCEEGRLEIPFHIGDDHSRTWVLTRTESGIQLQHDHRHKDGSEDAVSLYGGQTTDVGTKRTQSFPADDFSKELFKTHGLDVSTANVWSMVIVPGESFSYVLMRPERHFQAEFDLTQTVPTPPTPWGHE